MRAMGQQVLEVSGIGSVSVWFAQRPLAIRNLWLLGILALAGCTTVGVHTSEREHVDFGPPVTIRVCVLKAADISQNRAERLKHLVQEEFAQYGLLIEVPWVREWERPGFQARAIMHDLLQRPLEPPCDRLFGFVDRHVGDFAWGLLMPEVLGAVDSVTATRGFVVATFGSINQLIAPPEQTIVHEFYHLFGCPHGVTLSKCYPKIAALKASVQPDADFFPGVSRLRPGEDEAEAGTGKGKTGAEAPDTFLTTRAQVDATIAAYFADAAKPKKAQNSRELTDPGSR